MIVNRILINGEIASWDISAEYVRNKLNDMTGDIQVDISSYGGSVYEGIEIFNMLKSYDKGVITTVVNAKAMSIASLIFLAGDIRKAYDNSTIMIHKAWTATYGNNVDLIKEAKVLGAIDLILQKEYNKYQNKSVEEIDKLMTEETYYTGLNELKESGFVTDFIKSDDNIDMKPNNSYREANLQYKAKFDKSKSIYNEVNVKQAILDCNGGKCPYSAVMPSDNEKITTLKQGELMDFSEENFNKLVKSQEKLNAKLVDYDQLKADKLNLDNKISELNVTLDSKISEISEITASFDVKLSEANNKHLEDLSKQNLTNEVRIREAFAHNIDNVDTIINMLKADSDLLASNIALEFRVSNQGTSQGNSTPISGIDTWNNIIKKGSK